MYRIILWFFVSIISLNGLCQNSDEIIMQISDKAITKKEFERLYRKNNNHLLEGSEIKTPEEYLDLFINFKLKVLEAERLGCDTLPGFVSELKNYRQELAHPYLTSVQYTDKMVKAAYERMKEEVNASHILVRLQPDASAQDTLEAWNKINEIRLKITQGAEFENIAEQYSEDPSAKQNRGNLGYFSVFQMVYPFEDAAYRLDIGKISHPIRTDFGYHLIKVNDKRSAKGQIKVAHIMKKVGPDASEETVKHQKQVIDSLTLAIKNGADFAELARKNSDDRRSAQNGGELAWFSSSNMMPEFAEPAFSLKEDGAVSPVIRTPYGWHLIKRIDYHPIPSFDEAQDLIIDKIKKDPAISKHNKDLFIQKLKKEYNFHQDESALTMFLKELEPAIDISNLKKPGQTLFSFADQSFTKQAFMDYFSKKSDKSAFRKTNSYSFIKSQYEDFVSHSLLDYENTRLEEKYPEFRYLVKEYHDGILLFTISEDKIWNAAVNDSTGLEAFYQKNSKKYQWGERFLGWVIKADNQQVRDFIDAVFDEDPTIKAPELEDQVHSHFGQEQAEITYGYFEKGSDELVDYLVWDGPKPNDYNEVLDFIRGNKVAPEPKTLKEAKGLYISDYQDYLEKKWLKELRKRYKIRINKKVLQSIESVK